MFVLTVEEGNWQYFFRSILRLFNVLYLEYEQLGFVLEIQDSFKNIGNCVHVVN